MRYWMEIKFLAKSLAHCKPLPPMNVTIILRFVDCVWAFHLALFWFRNSKLGKEVFDGGKGVFMFPTLLNTDNI